MENENSKYIVPDELIDILNSSKANRELRNRYIRIPFGYKKALRCTKNAIKQEQVFWSQVEELYPELKGKKLYFNQYTKCLTAV